jgi:micrococcal nuclease
MDRLTMLSTRPAAPAALLPFLLLLLLLAGAVGCEAPPADARDAAGAAGAAGVAGAPAQVPEGMRYAASVRGTTYYPVSCDAWKRIAPANLRFFRTAGEARGAGLRPTAQARCAAEAVGDVASADVVSPGLEAAEPGTAAGAGAATCVVARIVDGDTLVCAGGERVRLLLIDAPELSQAPFGAAARRALEALAPPGTWLGVEHDVRPIDRYGRTLAYLWLADGRMVNEELLRAGVALVAVYPPNVRHVERLRAAVAEARAAGAGLWATTAFECGPADHRAGRC